MLFSYCVSCYKGDEAELCTTIAKVYGCEAIFPKSDHERLRDGQWVTTEYALMPGYVFVYSRDPVDADKFYRLDKTISVMRYRRASESAYNVYELQGADLRFAEWVYAYQGHIGISRVMKEGDEIVVVDGPLKHFQGNIKRIHRHSHNALVEIDFGNRKCDIWLGFQWVTFRDGVCVRFVR